MNQQNNKKPLGELISRAIGRDSLKFDFEKWKSINEKEIRICKSQITDEQTSRSTVVFNIWSTIIKSRITKLTAAALIIIAVLFGINYLVGPIDGASMLYARVKESIEKKPWIHAKHTILRGENVNSGEEWFSFERKIAIGIEDNGKIQYFDFYNQKRYDYLPAPGTITISQIKEPPSFLEAKTPLELCKRVIEMKQASGAEFSQSHIERDGKTLEIWEVVQLGAKGSEKIKLFIDTQEYLPMVAEVSHTDHIGKSTYHGTIKFEYPEVGPKNIYELGVPKDAKTVYFKGPDLEVTTIAAEYDKRRRQLGDFRALTIYTGANNKSKFTIFEYLPGKNKRRQSISREIAGYDSKSLDELVDTLVSDSWPALLDVKSKIFPTGHLPNNIILLEPKMVDVFSDYYVGEWEILTSDNPELSNKVECQLKRHNRTGVYLQTWCFDPENDFWVSKFTLETLESYEIQEDNAIVNEQYQVTAFNKTISGHLYPSQIIQQRASSNQVVQARYDIYMEEATHAQDVDRAFIERALKTLLKPK